MCLSYSSSQQRTENRGGYEKNPWQKRYEQHSNKKAQTELGEYSVDGGDQAGFGVVGGHVGDVLNVWPNEVVQWVQVGGRGGQWEKGTKS